MLDKIEAFVNHIGVRIFGGSLLGGAAYALHDGLLTQWPAVAIAAFALFLIVPTQLRSFVEFVQGASDSLRDMIGK